MTERPNTVAPDDTSPESLMELMGLLDAFKAQLVEGEGESLTSALVSCLERAAWRKHAQAHRPVLVA